MAAAGPAGGAAVAAADPCAAVAAAASTSPPALEVTGLPQSMPGDELAVLIAHLRSAGRVITAYAQPGGVGSGGAGASGAALVLLPPGTPQATATQLAAGGLLAGCQLDVRMLQVSLCSDPAGWVQRALGAELPASPAAQPLSEAAALQQPLQPEDPDEQLGSSTPFAVAGSSPASPVNPVFGGSSGGVANGSAEAAGTGTDGCAMPSSGTLSRAISSGALPDTLPHGMAVSSSSGALPDTLPHGMAVSSSSGGGSSMPPCSGGSSTGAAASGVAEPQAAGNSCLVIHNLSPYVMAWQVVEFFSQFGEVVECTKRPGATLAFVRFAQVAQAARAKEAVHYRMVPHMGQREPLSIQYRKQQLGRSGGSVPLASRSRTGGLPPLSGCSRGSSGSEVGGRESGGSEAGGSEGDCSGDSGAEGRAQVLPATPQYLSGGRALVVKNLPLSLPYEAVRVFFSQFGKLTSCYKQTQAPFAFVTYSQPEAAAAALRSVNGMLCPDLNVASLIRVEYRRGASTRHTSSSSAAAITGVSTHADRAPTQPGSSDGSSLSSRSESVHSESTAFNECCESSIRAYRGGGGGSHASLAFHSGSGDLECLPYPYPAPGAYAVAFAYPCYLAPI